MKKSNIFRIAVKASSLIEVITAMVIASIVFGISILIFMNIQRSTESSAEVTIKSIMKNIVEEAIINSNWNEDLIIYQDWKISKKIIPYKENDNLKILLVEAYDAEGVMHYENKNLVQLAE